jgi:glycosyltransferase involved in cell wall biosynthesis/precorrin-6B methylase 2
MKKGTKKLKIGNLKASYCVPCYNKVEYLADAIESFLEQDYENKELIIGDDASTDKTYQLANFYASEHKNIKYFRVDENIGVASMRNRLIEKAKGDVIFIMDADDMSEINRTKDTMEVFNSRPTVDIVYGNCIVVNGFGTAQGFLNGRDLAVWELKTNNFIPHPTLAFRKSIPVRYREGLRFIDDWYFHLDCVAKGLKFEYIPKVLGIYRYLDSGLTMEGGFSNKEKESKKQALRDEFKEFDDDISENLALKSHQRTRIKKVILSIPKDSKVLDLGANGGYIATCLKQKGCKVKCFEIAPNLIEICKNKGLDVEKKDARDFDIDSEYDIVWAGDILEHMPPNDFKKVLENSYKALKKGGKLIATVPYKHSFYNAARIVEHVKDYDLEDFKTLFDKFEYTSKSIYIGDMSVSVWLIVEGKK